MVCYRCSNDVLLVTLEYLGGPSQVARLIHHPCEKGLGKECLLVNLLARKYYTVAMLEFAAAPRIGGCQGLLDLSPTPVSICAPAGDLLISLESP